MGRRLTLCAIVTIVAAVAALTSRAVSAGSPRRRARIGSRGCRIWASTLCRVFGVRVEAEGVPPGQGFMVAANHLSYVDILALGSLYPGTFVAKHDIASWPVFGWIAAAAGTLFVDRRKPRDVVRVAGEMKAWLDAGVGVTLFPEGTTSRGADISPFLSSLLSSAAASGAPCFAAALHYETPGEAESPARTVCWVDGAPFGPHFLRLLRLPRIVATVRFAPMPVRSGDRRQLAEQLWDDARALFVPIRQESLP